MIYQKRLQSNLRHALRPLTERPDETAAQLAALIDGLYIRAALDPAQTGRSERIAIATLTALLSPEPRP